MAAVCLGLGISRSVSTWVMGAATVTTCELAGIGGRGVRCSSVATRLRFLPSLLLVAWLDGGVDADVRREVSVCAYGLNSKEICWSDCKGDTAQVLWWLVTALVVMGDAIIWVDLVAGFAKGVWVVPSLVG